jgi:glycosyltransferase involved in cell wall biosynthesis
MKPEISVLVATCDRPQKLRRVLEDLQCQGLEPQRFEVIVADDGSDPPAAEVLAELKPSYPLAFVRGPQSGPATSRNRALPRVRAPLLLFLNDDVRLEPDLLEAHLEAHARSLRPTAILGVFEFTPAIRSQPLNRLVEEVGIYGTAHIPAGMALTPLAFCTGNLSVPTAEVLAVGGFDPAFPEPAGEDLDLGYRLLHERGVPLIHDTRARAWHDHPHDFTTWRDRWKMWGEAFWLLACKHRDELFWPGGTANTDLASRRSARARLAVQEPLALELIGWLERLSAGAIPEADVHVRALDRTFRLPDEAEALMRAGLNITIYFVQRAFWDAATLHPVEA